MLNALLLAVAALNAPLETLRPYQYLGMLQRPQLKALAERDNARMQRDRRSDGLKLKDLKKPFSPWKLESEAAEIVDAPLGFQKSWWVDPESEVGSLHTIHGLLYRLGADAKLRPVPDPEPVKIP